MGLEELEAALGIELVGGLANTYRRIEMAIAETFHGSEGLESGIFHDLIPEQVTLI